MSVTLSYQCCHGCSTQQERWPCHPLVSVDSTGESSSVMMTNVTWVSRASREETQCLLKLREAKFPADFSLPVGFVPLDSFLSFSPRAGGDAGARPGSDTGQGSAAPSHGRGASARPSRAIRLRGSRISAGLSNNGRQPRRSLRYWKHMFGGEKEKKAAELPRNRC